MTDGAAQHDIDVGDGLTIHVETRGRGSPLVLLHGFTGSSRTWHALGAALEDRFTTIAVDLPGHGRSGAPADPARYAIARFGDDLARVLDALRVDRVAILGYSFGGRTALRFALAHPERVTHLVLEGASPGIDDPAERLERRVADDALADRIERQSIARFVEEWERLPLWASQQRLTPAARAALRDERLRNRPHGLANSLRGAGAAVEASVFPALPGLRVPTLLLVGALDTKYVAEGERMGGAILDATLCIIPDAGHAVHLEQPAAFAAAVASFLAGHVTSARDTLRHAPGAPAR